MQFLDLLHYIRRIHIDISGRHDLRGVLFCSFDNGLAVGEGSMHESGQIQSIRHPQEVIDVLGILFVEVYMHIDDAAPGIRTAHMVARQQPIEWSCAKSCGAAYTSNACDTKKLPSWPIACDSAPYKPFRGHAHLRAQPLKRPTSPNKFERHL